MEFYIRQYFYQRRKHYLSIVSLTIGLMMVICMNNICKQINETIEGFYQKQGLEINCTIILNDYDDFSILDQQAVRCHYSSFGENEVIIVSDDFFELFSFDYFLNDETEGIVVSYQFYEDNGFKNDCVINGIGIPVSKVLSQDNSNIYFDCQNLIILPEQYLNMFEYTETRYFYKDDLALSASEESYESIKQSSLKEGFDTVMKVIEKLLKMISFITLSVAIVSQSNHSLLLLEYNSRIIGIKKANGASERDIVREILFENILTALLSDILAVMISEKLLSAVDIDFKATQLFLSSLKPAVFIVILSSSIPAIKSKRITIVDSIRKDY